MFCCVCLQLDIVTYIYALDLGNEPLNFKTFALPITSLSTNNCVLRLTSLLCLGNAMTETSVKVKDVGITPCIIPTSLFIFTLVILLCGGKGQRSKESKVMGWDSRYSRPSFRFSPKCSAW